MTIYIVTLICILCYGLFCFYSGVSKKRKLLFIVLSFTHLCIVMALRAPTVGSDTLMYSNLFINTGLSNDFWNVAEGMPVYLLYSKLIYIFSPHVQTWIAVNAIIICASVAYFIYCFSENVVVSTYAYVTLYFYLFSFNASRQSLALALMLLAVCALRKRRLLIVPILAALAIGIHNTSACFVPMLLFSERNVSPRRIAWITVLSVVMLFSYSVLFDYLLILFTKIFPRYRMYLGGGVHTVYDIGRGRNIYLTIFYLAFIIAALMIIVYRKKLNISEETLNKLLYLTIPALITVAMGFADSSNLAVGRIRDYYSIFMICLIPCVINIFTKEKYLLNMLAMAVMFIPFIVQLAENKSHVLPYILFWNA